MTERVRLEREKVLNSESGGTNLYINICRHITIYYIIIIIILGDLIIRIHAFLDELAAASSPLPELSV